MAHPRRRAREETSAGGVVFHADRGVPRFLLIRDSYQNWGFPKGHVEQGEEPEGAAAREVTEETGLTNVALRAPIDIIDWYFTFRGQLIHKFCHFFLMESSRTDTSPQEAEGITACEWLPYDEAQATLSHANARDILRRANEMVSGLPGSRA